MKTKKLINLLFGILLSTGITFGQAIPPPPAGGCTGPNPLASTNGALSCNTANNGSGGSLPVGSFDNFWQASNSGISGPYTPAYVCGKNVWPGSTWVNPLAPSCNWITFPHMGLPGCTTCTNQAQHTGLGDVDEFYRLQFCLPDSVCNGPIASKFCLKMTFKADNSVYKIYVNGTSYYTNTGTNLYQSTDYSQTGGVTKTFCSGWQAGLNTLIVHIKSGEDFTGFMTLIDTAALHHICDNPEPPQGCCLGNGCGNSQNALTTNYEVPMNGFKFNFTGDALDKVNVGYPCGTSGIGKFNTVTSMRTNQDGSSPESVSIFGHNKYGKDRETSVGVMGLIQGQASGETGIGVYGFANTEMFKYRIGVSGIAFPTTTAPAPHTYRNFYPNGASIGVYGSGALQNSVKGNPGPDWAGWFDGDVKVNGNAYGTAFIPSSDRRFKQNINPLENITEKIMKIKGYTYSFKSSEFKERGFDDKIHIGFIAQEIKEVFPELISEDSKGFYGVDYMGMIPVLLEVVKAQQQQLADQQSQINELKTLTQTTAGKTVQTSIPVILSDNTFVLNQNVPNPFAESTVIRYNIPGKFTSAQIIFRTNDGRTIKTIDIASAGKGSITVFADDLSNGTYIYSIVIDGKVIESKTMVKQ